MIGWFQGASKPNPKELFPIENLPQERLGDRRGDALALLYRKALPAQAGKMLPRPINVDKDKELFFKRIFPILDGFDQIFKYAENSRFEEEDSLSNWLKTTNSLYTRLQSALEKEGLTAIESVGKMMDLSVHEVIDTRSDPSQPNNMILEEMVRGYQYGKRVLRDAKVIVNRV